ncbi:MAG: DNA cytosine methyltransferase, partial [Candidatus Entotheonellia bacterium]
VQAVECDSNAAATYRKNHAETDLIHSAIENIDPSKCMTGLGIRPGDLSILIGGPPCQGFSESNRRTRNLDNPRNHLYKEFIRFLAAFRPTWFVIENVAGLRTLLREAILQRIIEECRNLGYEVTWGELNAVDYGVPQFRHRLFIVGNRLGLPMRFPSPTHGPGRRRWVTVRQAIADLPTLGNGWSEDYMPYALSYGGLTQYQRLMRASMNGSRQVQGNLVTRNAARILRRYAHIKPGQNWEAIPAKLMYNYKDRSRCHTGIYYRLEWDKPAKVIGNFRKNMLIHPEQDRGLSVREAARLQSFPDNYIFVGSVGFQQQQVADAVPPVLAEAVARRIIQLYRAEHVELLKAKGTL